MLGAAGLIGLSLAGCKRAPSQQFHGVDITGATYAKDFSLTDPNGKTRTLADFKGKAIMMFFGFTQCPDVCPTALVRAATVKQLLGADGDRLQVIFVTVDPERDTPEILKAYTAAFDPSFLGLYGDLKHTEETAKDFKVFYKKVPTGSSYTMDHSALSYVYDPDGKLRLVLRHTQSAEEYAADLRQLLHPA
ncbi:SCO family protein [Acidovorax sp. SDU_ACID1]|uniref:SCO family protein n=1 Tax=Acidovorax sp. SDU_ACID1 TaxID=3136632 RepID=UPI003872DE9C